MFERSHISKTSHVWHLMLIFGVYSNQMIMILLWRRTVSNFRFWCSMIVPRTSIHYLIWYIRYSKKASDSYGWPTDLHFHLRVDKDLAFKTWRRTNVPCPRGYPSGYDRYLGCKCQKSHQPPITSLQLAVKTCLGHPKIHPETTKWFSNRYQTFNVTSIQTPCLDIVLLVYIDTSSFYTQSKTCMAGVHVYKIIQTKYARPCMAYDTLQSSAPQQPCPWRYSPRRPVLWPSGVPIPSVPGEAKLHWDSIKSHGMPWWCMIRLYMVYWYPTCACPCGNWNVGMSDICEPPLSIHESTIYTRLDNRLKWARERKVKIPGPENFQLKNRIPISRNSLTPFMTLYIRRLRLQVSSST